MAARVEPEILDRSHIIGVRRRLFLAGLALFTLLSCELTLPGATSGAASTPVSEIQGVADRPPIGRAGTYRLQPGDRVNVFVFDYPDLSQTAVVGPDGNVNVALAGTVRAEGITLAALDDVLTERLRANILQPEVTVALEDVGASRIYVTGEVVSPGVYEVPGPVSVVQALSIAGGFTAFARRNNVIVYNPARSSEARRRFNYDAFLANPGAFDIALRPGDIVIVQ